MLSVLMEECHVGDTRELSFKDNFSEKVDMEITIFSMAAFHSSVCLDFFL